MGKFREGPVSQLKYGYEVSIDSIKQYIDSSES
jgi:hypothetical protein